MTTTTRKFNEGLWTKARFDSFIKSALRAASLKWPPRWKVLKEAFTGIKINQATGRKSKHYLCAKCQKEFPTSQIEVNHKISVVPFEGLTSWDVVIDRLFCEPEGLEAVCKDCHKQITKQEKEERKMYTAGKQKGNINEK